MRPLIDSLQRITATALVAGLYLLPAALGGIAGKLDATVDAVTSPERVAAYIMEIPALAEAPAAEEEPAPEKEKEPEPAKRAPSDDMLAMEGGVPTASEAAKKVAESQRTSKGKNKGEGSKKGRRQQCMASTGQVTSTGGNSYQIERALLDYYFGHTAEAEKLGSAAWYRDDDGDIAGIRIRRVRCGSPVEEAGLKQGDIIRAANGKKVDSLAGVVALWWQLRSKDNVKLVITRDGQRKRLRYSLV